MSVLKDTYVINKTCLQSLTFGTFQLLCTHSRIISVRCCNPPAAIIVDTPWVCRRCLLIADMLGIISPSQLFMMMEMLGVSKR